MAARETVIACYVATMVLPRLEQPSFRSRIAVWSRLAIAVFAFSVLPGCRPCNTLDERICEKLGPEDCAVWKGPLHKAGSPSAHGSASSGSLRNKLKGRHLVESVLYGENGRMCRNALDAFEQVASGIEASVEAYRTGQDAQ